MDGSWIKIIYCARRLKIWKNYWWKVRWKWRGAKINSFALELKNKLSLRNSENSTSKMKHCTVLMYSDNSKHEHGDNLTTNIVNERDYLYSLFIHQYQMSFLTLQHITSTDIVERKERISLVVGYSVQSCLLFYRDKTFVHYDRLSKSVIKEGKLPFVPY